MKNMTNKQIYNYLKDNKDKSTHSFNSNNGFFVSKLDMFEYEEEDKKIYGYYESQVFNYDVFLRNLTSSFFWFITFFYLSMWALVLIVGLNFEFVLEELDRIDTWGKSIFIIIAIAYLINLFIQFPKFIKNFGGCTIKYIFYEDGTKDTKIFDTDLEK